MEDEFGRERGRCGRDKKFMILFEKLEGKGHLGDIARGGNVILKYSLQKQGLRL
jgi:hypothetical protein